MSDMYISSKSEDVDKECSCSEDGCHDWEDLSDYVYACKNCGARGCY